MTPEGHGDAAEPDAAMAAGADPAAGNADADDLRRDVAKLSAIVRALAATVARLAGAMPANPDRGDAGNRTDSQDGTAGKDLVAWVRWLVARYELDNIPDCWIQHGALVEELDAFRVGWLDAIGKGQGGLAGMQGHARTKARKHLG